MFAASHPFAQYELWADPSGNYGVACKANEPAANSTANLLSHHIEYSVSAECIVQLLVYYTAREVMHKEELFICYGSTFDRGDNGCRGNPPSHESDVPVEELEERFQAFCDDLLVNPLAVATTFGAEDGHATSSSQESDGNGLMDAILERNSSVFNSNALPKSRPGANCRQSGSESGAESDSESGSESRSRSRSPSMSNGRSRSRSKSRSSSRNTSQRFA